MSLRDVKKEKTAQKFRTAMARIIEGVPTSRKLKKRANLKLNQSTVEEEAGLTVGSLRHHEKILKEIEAYNFPKAESESYKGSDENAGRLKRENEKLRLQRKKALKEKLLAKKKKQEQLEKINKLTDENILLHERTAEVISALFYSIPQEDRQDLFEKSFKLTSENVVPIK